jgi:inner membrane protein involved in colicin E2 resistance
MSFGGHVINMVNRIKQNNALKNTRRRKFKGGNDYSKISTTKTEYDFPKVSKLKLDQLKTSIRAKAKKETKKQLKFIIIFIVITFFIFFIFNFYKL